MCRCLRKCYHTALKGRGTHRMIAADNTMSCVNKTARPRVAPPPAQRTSPRSAPPRVVYLPA
ncbi:MAG: hypothetical protein Kow0074_26320 [Candidatus Zixiibacteriota bacterium]